MKLRMVWQALAALTVGLALVSVVGCSNPANGGGGGSQTPLDDIAWTATPSGSPTTNAIVFGFDAVPTGLLATDITITAGTGSATRGALTGSGTTRTLTVTDVSAGTVSVSINRSGIAPGPQTVTLAAPDVGGDILGSLFAGSPPILPSAIPINLSGTTATTGDTIVDRAIAFVNANPGTYTLVLNGDVSVSWFRQLNTNNVNLYIIGSGTERRITQTSTGAQIFGVGNILATTDTNISLTLGENITLVGRQGNTSAAVTVVGGATLIMRDNARITGNYIHHLTPVTGGGGVFVQGGMPGSGTTTFTMRDNSSVQGNSRVNSGGGVRVDAGAVFNMYDNASVSGNSSTGFGIAAASMGGGVDVHGTFNMHGGTISGNTTGGMGGGVYVRAGGTFVMSGGTVYGDDVSDPLRNSGHGAALFLSSGASVARFGDGSDILPHTDNNNRHTNNTITGRLTGQYPPVVTWDAAPAGSPTTTHMNFTFSADPGGLVESDITISSGTGSAARGGLSGTGTMRTLAVSGVNPGTVTVSISRVGIEPGPQTVTLVSGPGDMPFVPVTGITGVPTTAIAGTPIPLSGTVAPANATNSTIVWTVRTQGTTGATIIGDSVLHATGAGMATVRATIVNGANTTTDFVQDFTITVNAAFVPVTGITSVPTAAIAGTPLALSGTVAPANATNSTIAWTVQNQGTTGATISGGTLHTTNTGTAMVRATIANGAGATTDFTQDFTVTVNAAFVPVTGITRACSHYPKLPEKG